MYLLCEIVFVAYNWNMNTKELLEKIRNNTKEDMIPPKSSAVIIPLVEISGEIHVLFEVRSPALKFQPGEVCFPGGRIEAGEAPMDAALREISEELLIDSGKTEIISSLAPLFGPTGSLVYPYVALLHDYKMTYSTDEVAKVFTYPISFFKEHPANRYPMQKPTIPPDNFPFQKVTGGTDTYNWHVQKYDMWIYEDTDPVVWGFTGRLLHAFLELI